MWRAERLEERYGKGWVSCASVTTDIHGGKYDVHSRGDGSVCGGGTTDVSCVFSYP